LVMISSLCGVFSTEQGKKESYLHFQGITIMIVPTAAAAQKYIANELGNKVRLAVRALTQKPCTHSLGSWDAFKRMLELVQCSVV
jgi:hypothetical protein